MIEEEIKKEDVSDTDTDTDTGIEIENDEAIENHINNLVTGGEEILIPDESEAEKEGKKTEENQIVRIDSSGIRFNSEIHISPDSLTSKGNFRKKKKPKSVLGDTKKQAPVDKDVIFKGAAEITVQSMETFCSGILGEEWLIINGEERRVMTHSFYNYFKSKDISDLPPNLILAIVLSNYAGKRVVKPKTKSKLGLFWSGIKKVFKKGI